MALSKFSVAFCGFPDSLSGILGGCTSYIPELEKYFVMIDSNRPKEEQIEALKHELVHVYMKHAEKALSTMQKEAEAESKSKNITDEDLWLMLSFADSIEYDENAISG